MRAIYPVSGLLSATTVDCSNGAPSWQQGQMYLGIWSLRASASQSAFIDQHGNLHHCEAGWEGHSLFSHLVTKNSKFQYGSLTKPITSALILRLVLENKLGLDTNLAALFDQAVEGGGVFNGLTVENILTHRAGVAGDVFGSAARWCPNNMDELTKQKSWEVASGSHQYSNLNYCILGAAVSKLSGKPFRDVAEDMLGLSYYGIGFVDIPKSKKWVAPDYRYHDFYRNDVQPNFSYRAISSTAGLGGSASAYALLMRDIVEGLPGRYLLQSDESCNAKKIRRCYGYLFYAYFSPSGELLRVKEGYMPGYSSVVVVNVLGEVFVWLGNSDTPNAKEGVKMTEFLNSLSSSSFSN